MYKFKAENPNEYLKKLLGIAEYEPTEHDVKSIKFNGIESYIFDKLTSTKYRGSSIPDVLEQKVKKIIHDSVAKGSPIHISLPFGGYKKWQFPTYPNPDWSEVFNIVYLGNFCREIASLYHGGVVINYVSDEVFISRMNKYPQSDIDSYSDNFQIILAWMNKFMPAGIELRFNKIRDSIGQKEVINRFESNMIEYRKLFDEMPEEEQQKLLDKTGRNLMIDPNSLTSDEYRDALIDSTLIHEIFIKTEWDSDVDWAFQPHMIPVGFRYTGSWGMHLKSNWSSTVQFWIGMGILKLDNSGQFMPHSITYNNYLKNIANLVSHEVNIFPKETPNFGSINVLKQD